MMNKTTFLLTILMFFLNVAFSQSDSIKPKDVSKADSIKTKVKTGQEFYIGASNGLGYRTLNERDGLFGAALGIREKERAHWTYSFELGARMPMGKNFGLAVGMEFIQIGVRYTHDTDSSFLGYRTVNRYLSLPIKAFYQSGEDFIIQAGLGLQPRFFLSSGYTEINLNDFGQEVETTTKTTNGFNTIALNASVHLGFRWHVMENIGLYFIPEFRYGLFDELDKQQPHVQRSYGLVLRWGLHWVI
jgi:hypothetical protein